MRKPTLQSLAAELRVSRQTVSNVMNAPEKVSPETRQRVLEAIERSGYRPSVAARALRKQCSMSLGLRLAPIVDGINGAMMDGFLHAIVEQANQRGYRIVLFTARDVDDELTQLVQLHDSNAIDGCFLTDTHPGDPRPEHLTRAGIPVACFGRPWQRQEKHIWVDVDNRQGTMAATRHLQSLGHERIGFIGWPEESGVGADRRAGWEAVVKGPSERHPSVTVVDTVSNGATAMRHLLDQGVNAAVCVSDSIALGALTELGRAGGGAVVGFDDTPVARAVGLSSVRQPVEGVTQTLLDLLINQLEGTPKQPNQVLLSPTFIPRNVANFLF